MVKPDAGPVWAVAPTMWGATVDYDSWNDPYTADDAVALHHGGGGVYAPSTPPYSTTHEMAQLRAWEDYHVNVKGWRGLAYGWGVGQTGTVYRIRGWNTYGAHTGDVDADHILNNSEIIPILFIGSGSRVELSPECQHSVFLLRQYLNETVGKNLYLYGHKELKGTVTSCPGQYGMQYVTANRWLVEGEEMVRRTDKADDGVVGLRPVFNEAVQKGIMTVDTQPGGVTFNDELAAFLDRQEKHIMRRVTALLANAGVGVSETRVKEIVESAKLEVS